MSELYVCQPEDVYGRGFWAALDWPTCRGILYRPPRYFHELHGPVVNTGAKISRNEPCPCGSGRKFKKCCA